LGNWLITCNDIGLSATYIITSLHGFILMTSNLIFSRNWLLVITVVHILISPRWNRFQQTVCIYVLTVIC